LPNQLIFVGNIRRGTSQFVEKDSLDRIEQKCLSLGLSGLIIYTSGNFLALLEGGKDQALAVQQAFRRHEDISMIITLLEEEIEKVQFSGIKFAYCKSDTKEEIPDSIDLKGSMIHQILPKDTSTEVAILIENFTTVNQVSR